MEANQGYAPDSDAWARARLRRGRSVGEIWEISAEYPEARLTLGCDPSAGWQIEANGVKELHCELFWDGQSLWVADTQQAGGVFLDGQRVRDWMQVQGPAEIRFGQASLDIETSAPPSQRMMSSPQLARPVTVTDGTGKARPRTDPRGADPIMADPVGVFGGAAGDSNVPALDSAATSIARAPLGIDPMEAARTEMVRTPESRGIDLRPRLGGGGGAAPAKPHAGEATKMVAMPAAPARPPPPPSLGSPSAVVAPPPAASSSLPTHRVAPVAAPPPPPPGSPDPATVPPPASAAGPGPGLGAGTFAPPPEPTAPEPKEDGWLVRTLKHEKSPQTEGKQALPLRTWILLAVTVLVTVGWLLWDDTPEPQAAASPPPGAVVVVPGAGDPTPPPETEPGPETEIPTAAEADTAPSSPEDEGSEPEDEDGPTLQRRAADAYGAGRHLDALEHYRRLAAQDPESGAWPAMVRILERRTRQGEDD